MLMLSKYILSLSGLATMGVLFVVNNFAAIKHAHYDRQLKKYADERMKIASQVLSGIKVGSVVLTVC